MKQNFCHLHVHDEYSLLDGYGTAKKYAKRAKKLGFEYLGSTNHGSIDGLIKFQKACDAEGIKPVMGCELYIVPNPSIKGKEKRGHITVLVKNEVGFKNLCKMLTKANLDGFHRRPRIGFNDILDLGEGLVIMTACTMSFLHLPGGEDLFKRLIEKYPDDVYLEVMPHDMTEQWDTNQLCADLADKYDVPLVATNDCHYIDADDAEVQEVLLAIQSKAKWDDPNRWKFSIDGLYLKTEKEMVETFRKQKVLTEPEIKEAIETTLEISRKCADFRIPKRDIFLPKVPQFVGKKEDFLFDLAIDRLHDYLPDGSDDYLTYKSRLDDEWKLISEKGFVDYFAIVYELIGWCKDQGIMTGPGRGSVGGSLLAFLIGITNVDPIKHNLLFSRFIAENRIDYPDIDIDFEDVKRDQVRIHLEELYGRANISSISTFLTMKGRAAIRDVGRVFDVPYQDVDEFAKVMDEEDEDGVIAYAVKNTPEGKEFYRQYPKVVELAIKLEGQVRGAGQHAAAIVVSAEDLSQGFRGNLCRRGNHNVSNWDMQDSEFVGLMKLDVLGLNTLSILNETRQLIKKNKDRKIFYHRGSGEYKYMVQDVARIRPRDLEHLVEVPLDYNLIPLDDPQVYKDLGEGNTVGVFQLNTWSGTKLSKELKTNNFRQIVDNLALVRPGPYQSGMTAEYVDRHWGAKWDKKHKVYEDITKDTYGLIVYQEQVMEVIHKVAGLPYQVADKIRKVISKKRDIKEFEPYKVQFMEGCRNMGYFSDKDAEWFWDALQEHASYSFNLSHSVEYAMVAYWTAWVKTYFPAEFLCASLTYGSETKKAEIIEEAKRLGLKIVLPRIGVSDATKWIVRDGCLYVPFIEIKGVGEKTAIQAAEVRLEPDNKVKGFFRGRMEEGKKNTKLKNILHDVGAYGEPPAGVRIQDFFDFDLTGILSSEAKGYPNLYQLIGDRGIELQSLLALDFPGSHRLEVIKKVSYRDPELVDCRSCPLSQECEYGAVPPSVGRYNIMIVGEAPGKDEDVEGKGFIGKSGQLLWDELWKLDLSRDFFHITNMVKCFPRVTRTPTMDQIRTCRDLWLKKEIEKLDCRLILAFGNTCLKGLIDKDAGITAKSGTTQWVESLSAWVCWCVHPSWVIHARNESNMEVFRQGLKNFRQKIDALGGV